MWFGSGFERDAFAAQRLLLLLTTTMTTKKRRLTTQEQGLRIISELELFEILLTRIEWWIRDLYPLLSSIFSIEEKEIEKTNRKNPKKIEFPVFDERESEQLIKSAIFDRHKDEPDTQPASQRVSEPSKSDGWRFWLDKCCWCFCRHFSFWLMICGETIH